MCDSESEEFASADEEFEEIEPDELEEVLGSIKPADVSSRKPVQPTSPISDVEPVSKSSCNNAFVPEEEKTSSPTVFGKRNSERTTKSNTSDDANERRESTTPERDSTDKTSNMAIPSVTGKGEQVHTTDDDVGDVSEIVDSSKNTAPDRKSKPEPSVERPKSSKTTDESDQRALQKEHEPQVTVSGANMSKKSDEQDSPKPKKLVLKPAKPQMMEERPPRDKSSIEKSNVTTREDPKLNADEGWDDFDDDWGDFTVDGDAGATKLRSQKTQNLQEQSAMEARSSKVSFKDVDIDDIESKLNDFMKHKDDPPLTTVFDRLSTSEGPKSTTDAGQSWGSWKPSWGGAAVSFLSTASKSVASITTNITQVIESGIGVPNPEDLARRQAEVEAKLKAEGYIREENEPNMEAETSRKQAEDRFGFDQLMSGVTQISSKVITGGLDTLEGIGKKTMTILQENDPGLLNKRKLLGLEPNDGVILSQVLREAKAKTEERERNLKQIQKHQYKKKLHFETLFDDYHGLVHLEALEMLSKQASLKLESLMAPLTGKALEEMQETMSEVKELCEILETENDDADGLHSADDLEAKLKEAIVDLNPTVKVDFGEIITSWTEYTAWIDNTSDERSGQDIFEKAMHALAQTTALCVLRMHKLAEILLISEHHSTATEADVIVQLTTVFCWHLSGVATRFCSELTKMKDKSADENDSALITNIFLEGSNSTSYVQNAFQLFIPILQLGAA